MFEKSTQKLQMMNALQDLKKNLADLGPVPAGAAIYDYVSKFYLAIVKFITKYDYDNVALKRNMENFNELKKILRELDKASGPIVVGNPSATLIDISGVHPEKCARIFDIQELMEIKDSKLQKQIQENLTAKINENRNRIIKNINSVLTKDNVPNGILFRIFGEKRPVH